MIKLFLGITLFIGLLIGQPVDIGIADCAADSGTTLLVPVTIGTVTGRDIIGVDITLNFRPEVLDADSVWPGDVVPGSWLTLYNATTPGELIIGMAGADPLSGTGTLCTLKFTVIGRPNDTTTIHFFRCQLNEGSVPCTTDDGLFTVIAVGLEENEGIEHSLPLLITPNPFKNCLEINYQVMKKNRINITLYNAIGDKVKTLIDYQHEPGSYSFKRFDNKNDWTICKQGVYYLIINLDDRILKRKLIRL